MTDVKRLESSLNAAIKLAQDLYEDAEPVALWDEFYETISRLPIQQQLLISGEALKELAHVTLLKSDSVKAKYDRSSGIAAGNGLEDDIPDFAGVVLDEDWLSNIALKTSSLDLSQFVKPETRVRLPNGELLREELFGTDESLSDATAESSESLEQVMAIAHSESISDWQGTIMKALKKEPSPIDFWLLRQKTQLSPSALFLGLFAGDSWYMKRNEMVPDDSGYGSIVISLVDFEDETQSKFC